MLDPNYLARMNPQQRDWFYAEYEQARKEEVVGILLAFFLGTFGIHKFYIHRNTAGIFYLLFFWTGIPAILGFIDCFFMPGNVRAYNAQQAASIATQIMASAPPPVANSAAMAYAEPGALPTTQSCAACGRSVDPVAVFCPYCGAARATTA